MDLHKKSFQEYYGISEAELKSLLDKIFDFPKESTRKYLLMQIKKWYNGYSFPEGNLSIYNIWSLMNYFKKIYIDFSQDNNKNIKLLQPETYWMDSDSIFNHVLEILKSRKSCELLQQQLFVLASSKELDSNFVPKNQNLCDYLKGDITFPDIFPNLLLQAGYITYSENKKIRIPNQEILMRFQQTVCRLHISVKLDIKDSETIDILSQTLNRNLEDAEFFQKTVQNEVLAKITGDKNESYFQMLIGALVELDFLFNRANAKYSGMIEKTVKEGRIDNYFFPNKENTDYLNIHLINENKRLNDTNEFSVKESLLTAKWQIFCKNYISDPVEKFIFYKEKSSSWKVILRNMVFHKNSNDNSWALTMGDSLEYNYEQAKLIHAFFQRLPQFLRKEICDEKKKNAMMEKRRFLLSCFNVENLEDLLDLIISNKCDKNSFNRVDQAYANHLKREEVIFGIEELDHQSKKKQL